MGKENKGDRSVVRNQAYQKKGISLRQRHNERENETYYNADIDLSRSHMNVHFRENFRLDGAGDAVKETYTETFDRLITNDTISTRGLKSDAKVIDEMVFDVNTDYFDRNGGYAYAISFFEEAYRCAVKEIGGEQYILSAVMHADERNAGLSEKLGRDVYHYHLHVVYVPVVDKEVLWTKRCKDPALVGTVKETIKQVSHSKKWPRFKTADGWLNSYSLLQDRFHDHMKNAGYIGFERGEIGSTAEHVSTEKYKADKERERAAEYSAIAEEKQETVNALSVAVEQKQEAVAVLETDIAEKSKKSANLDKAVDKKQEKLNDLTEKTAVAEKVVVEFEEIEKIGHKRTMFGAVTVSDNMWTKILNLVKEAFNSRKKIKELRAEIKDLKDEVKAANTAFEQQKSAYIRLVERVQPYLDAVKMFPQQVKDSIASFISLGRKQQEERQWLEQERQKQQLQQEYTAPKRKRSNDLEF